MLQSRPYDYFFYGQRHLSYHYFNYRTTIEQINNEITTLDKRLKTIKKQIELPSTEDDIRSQMEDFIKVNDIN